MKTKKMIPCDAYIMGCDHPQCNEPTPDEVLGVLQLHRIPQAHRDIIVTAVSSHEELLQACKNAEAFLEDDCGLTKLQVLQSLTNAIENASA